MNVIILDLLGHMCFFEKCDQICEKGSYSLSEFLSLTDNHLQISPVNSTMLGVHCVNTMKAMGCQVHAIGKAIRPHPVTNIVRIQSF